MTSPFAAVQVPVATFIVSAVPVIVVVGASNLSESDACMTTSPTEDLSSTDPPLTVALPAGADSSALPDVDAMLTPSVPCTVTVVPAVMATGPADFTFSPSAAHTLPTVAKHVVSSTLTPPTWTRFPLASSQWEPVPVDSTVTRGASSFASVPAVMSMLPAVLASSTDPAAVTATSCAVDFSSTVLPDWMFTAPVAVIETPAASTLTLPVCASRRTSVADISRTSPTVDWTVALSLASIWSVPAAAQVFSVPVTQVSESAATTTAPAESLHVPIAGAQERPEIEVHSAALPTATSAPPASTVHVPPLATIRKFAESIVTASLPVTST